MRVFYFAIFFSFSFQVLAEKLSCQQHFQKMYSAFTDNRKLETNEKICREAFKTYLTQNVKNKCLNTVEIFCKSLTKNTKVENYSYNQIKAMATLQTGYLLGSSTTTAIANWISPHLDIPPPTTEKLKEKAQKEMTKSECLYQIKPKGTVSFRYNATQKRCYVKECKNLYVRSRDHSVCVFKAEEICLAKNQETRENRIKNIVSWGYGQGLRESADCYIASCVSGYSPNNYGTACNKDPEIVKKKHGVGGGTLSHNYKNGKYSDNPRKTHSHSFSGYSKNVYFTKNSTHSTSIPDGSPLIKSYISSMYGMRKRTLHSGIDLYCYYGDSIHSTGNGKVLRVLRKNNACGYSVKILHSDGITTSRYCHMFAGSIKVKKGDNISRGKVIGKCGNTGNSEGYHLHYEIEKNENKKNPIFYLTGDRNP